MSFQADSNAEQLARQLERAADDLGNLDAPAGEAGDLVGAGPAPRRSGRLAAGVTVAQIPNGVAVASTAPYFTYVHFGAPGRHVRAQPWLADQLVAQADRILDLYREHASDALAQVKG